MQTLTISKKTIGFILGALIALTLAAPALLMNADYVSAQAFEELFGGEDGLSSEEFASEAGLGSQDLPTQIARIIRAIMGFLGIVAVVIVLLGGFKWMTAGGNEDKVKEAKRLLIQGVIGLVIVISAFAIAQFVISRVAQVGE